MASEGGAARLVEEAVGHWGRLDAIIANAGVWHGGRLAGVEPSDWWSTVERNLQGTYRLVREALPYVSKSDAGSIVLMSSVVGLVGFPGDTAYATAKSALVGFARALAKEVAVDRVRVNLLAPGFIDTDMTAAVPEAARRIIEPRLLLGRFGQVDEVARAAVFLSEDATYSTGSILCTDGGWSL